MNPTTHLDDGETVTRRIYQHWIVLAPTYLASGALVAIAIVGAFLFGRFHTRVPQVDVSLITGLFIIVLGCAALIFLLGMFIYRQNYLLLTNLHLIEVTQHGLFNRTVSQLSLSRIQDVTGSRQGMLATMFDFGDVTVQSAGEEDKFLFRNTPDPEGIADYFLAAHATFMKSQSGSDGTE